MSEEIGELFNTITTIYINDRPVQAKLPSALQDSVIRKIDGKYYIEYGILDYIEHLQQKVEQLEKELQITANKCKQLENIRKEAIEYVKSKEFVENFPYVMNECQVRSFLLNILNKGSESNV